MRMRMVNARTDKIWLCCCTHDDQQGITNVVKDITADNMKYKHELSGDIREGQGSVVKNQEICGYSVYRLEKYGESYQVIANLLKSEQLQGVQQNSRHFCFLNFSSSLESRNSILDIFQ